MCSGSLHSAGLASSRQEEAQFLPVQLLMSNLDSACCSSYPAKPIRKLWLARKIINELLLYSSRCHDRVRVLNVARWLIWQRSGAAPREELFHSPWLGQTLLNVLVVVADLYFRVWQCCRKLAPGLLQRRCLRLYTSLAQPPVQTHHSTSRCQ